MTNYRHINDCWNELKNFWDSKETSAEDIETITNIIGDFPNRFGTWEITENDSDHITITNSYYDSQLDDWYEDSEYFYFDKIILGLEITDLLEYDKALNNIVVDKDIFDDFEKDAVVTIKWIDKQNEPIYSYQIVGETEDGIQMVIFT